MAIESLFTDFVSKREKKKEMTQVFKTLGDNPKISDLDFQ